ncbi:hypothetical protein [Stenotrophomonas sp. BIGb0135]|uniref:hypothetical protein n=1 Tax=Stenotrophomonas sp. BIGb0135 TaxID=2940620 RepID=UPI00216A849C|nr:hypothetical protein [Stenotrophomonas sp. BIGb0135]MCS4234462.1 hypothetical protein [Stenotrophomonas sp. BIGb0135]
MSNADELAYPTPHVWAERWEMLENIKPSEGGLTKRELIAAMVMQGMGTWVPNADHGPFNWDSPQAVGELKARWAIAQADALLAELERTA